MMSIVKKDRWIIWSKDVYPIDSDNVDNGGYLRVSTNRKNDYQWYGSFSDATLYTEKPYAERVAKECEEFTKCKCEVKRVVVSVEEVTDDEFYDRMLENQHLDTKYNMDERFIPGSVSKEYNEALYSYIEKRLQQNYPKLFNT